MGDLFIWAESIPSGGKYKCCVVIFKINYFVLFQALEFYSFPNSKIGTIFLYFVRETFLLFLVNNFRKLWRLSIFFFLKTKTKMFTLVPCKNLS